MSSFTILLAALTMRGALAQCAFNDLTFDPPEFSYTVRKNPGNAGETCAAGQTVPDGEGCYITKAGHTCHQPICNGTGWVGVATGPNVDCWKDCEFDNLILPTDATATGGGAFTSGPGSLQSHSAGDVDVFCSAGNTVPDGAMCAVSMFTVWGVESYSCTTAQCRQGVWNHITCSKTCITGNGCASRVPITFSNPAAWNKFEDCVSNNKAAGAEAWPWQDPVGAATCVGGVRHSTNTGFSTSRCNEWTAIDPVASEANCGIRAMVYLYEAAPARGTGDLTGPSATCTGCGAGGGFILISGKDPASEGATASVTSSEFDLDCYSYTMTIKYMLYMGNTAASFVDTASVKLFLSPDGTTWDNANKVWEWDGSDRFQDCDGSGCSVSTCGTNNDEACTTRNDCEMEWNPQGVWTDEVMQCANGADDWGTITVTVTPDMHYLRFEMTMDDDYDGQAGKLDFAFDNIQFTRINPLNVDPDSNPDPNSYTDTICDIFDTNDSQLRQSRDLGVWYWNTAGNFVDVAGSTVSTVDVKDQPWVDCASYAHGCTVLMWTSDHHLCSNSNKGLLWMFKDVTDMFYMPPCPDPAGVLEMEIKVAIFRSCDVGKATNTCSCDGSECTWMGQDYRNDVYHCVDIPAEPHRSRVTTFTVKASESDNCGAMACSGTGLERYAKYGCKDLS